VLDKFIVGWEASGRNGGGASHYSSPLFDEEQRLWPQMDELLGYPTEHQKGRILIAMTERQWDQYRFIAERHTRLNHSVELLDVKQVQEAVPLAGDNCFGGVHYNFCAFDNITDANAPEDFLMVVRAAAEKKTDAKV
jgi:sarcosine oxidase subunit beta